MLMLPFNQAAILVVRAYNAGAKDQRARNEIASPFRKEPSADRFDHIEYRQDAEVSQK